MQHGYVLLPAVIGSPEAADTENVGHEGKRAEEQADDWSDTSRETDQRGERKDQIGEQASDP